MSEIKNANDIVILKKRKKTLDSEASNYEFGFDTVPKKILLGNNKMVLVPLTAKSRKIKPINNKIK